MEQICTASRHGTPSAYRRARCRCPETVAHLRALWRKRAPRGLGWAQAYKSRAADIDEVAVERAVLGGERVPVLTIRERGVAIDNLTARGLSAREIGRQLGVADRTVVRYRTGAIKNAGIAA